MVSVSPAFTFIIRRHYFFWGIVYSFFRVHFFSLLRNHKKPFTAKILEIDMNNYLVLNALWLLSFSAYISLKLSRLSSFDSKEKCNGVTNQRNGSPALPVKIQPQCLGFVLLSAFARTYNIEITERNECRKSLCLHKCIFWIANPLLCHYRIS